MLRCYMGEKSVTERQKLWDEIYIETQNLMQVEDALKTLESNVPISEEEQKMQETYKQQLKNAIMNHKNKITRIKKKLNQNQ